MSVIPRKAKSVLTIMSSKSPLRSRRFLKTQNQSNARIAKRPTTPPTVPPTMAPMSTRRMYQRHVTTFRPPLLTGSTLVCIGIHTADHTLLRISTRIRHSDRKETRSPAGNGACGDGDSTGRDDGGACGVSGGYTRGNNGGRCGLRWRGGIVSTVEGLTGFRIEKLYTRLLSCLSRSVVANVKIPPPFYVNTFVLAITLSQ